VSNILDCIFDALQCSIVLSRCCCQGAWRGQSSGEMLWYCNGVLRCSFITVLAYGFGSLVSTIEQLQETVAGNRFVNVSACLCVVQCERWGVPIGAGNRSLDAVASLEQRARFVPHHRSIPLTYLHPAPAYQHGQIGRPLAEAPPPWLCGHVTSSSDPRLVGTQQICRPKVSFFVRTKLRISSKILICVPISSGCRHIVDLRTDKSAWLQRTCSIEELQCF